MAYGDTAEEVWPYVVDLITQRSATYEELYEYWVGENPLPIDSAEFRSRFGIFFTKFRDNLARPVVEVAAARTRITHFSGAKSEDAAKIWDTNELDSDHLTVHTDASVLGDAYVIVLPRKDGSPGIWPQLTPQVAILYSDEDPREKHVAIKWWVDEQVGNNPGTKIRKTRVNLYWPDRIERFISAKESESLNNDFSGYVEYSDEDVSSVTRHSVGEVPMFQFTVNADKMTGHGRSDLRDATPLIDVINKTFLDMLVASEYTAAPQRWATGVEIPLDPQTGQPMKTYQAGADRLWTAPNDAARFGQFASGELAGYADAVEMLVDHLAFVTRTPSYALRVLVETPSGDALRVVELPLRSKVADHQAQFRRTWRAVLKAALKLANVSVSTIADLEIEFVPVNHPFSTMEFMEELKTKAEVLGIPEVQLWAEAGYTPDEIERMKTMREEEASVGLNAADAIAATALRPAQGPATTTPPAGLSPEV